MSKILLNETTLQQTADAIRNKSGTSQLMTPAEMAAQINNISGQSKTPPRPTGVYAEVLVMNPSSEVTSIAANDCTIGSMSKEFMSGAWAGQYTSMLNYPVTLTIRADSSAMMGWKIDITDGATSDTRDMWETPDMLGLMLSSQGENTTITVIVDTGLPKASARAGWARITDLSEFQKLMSRESFTPEYYYQAIPISCVRAINFGDLAEGVATELPDYFGQAMYQLTAVYNVPMSVTRVGNNVFRYSGLMVDLSLPGVTSIGNDFLFQTENFNGTLSLPEVVSVGDNFLGQSTAYQQSVTLPKAKTIGHSFLGGTATGSIRTSFNAPVSLPSVETIGYSFMSSQTAFNQPMTFPSSLTSLSHLAFSGDYSLNSPITFEGATTVRNGLMSGCYAMTNVVNVGNSTLGSDNNSFATLKADAPCYTTGVTIAGANRNAWLSTCPDLSGPIYYRKLIDAGR